MMEKKESDQSKDDYIKLKVVDQNAYEVMFRVKKSIQMAKLKNSFAERARLEPGRLRFVYDGKRIQDTDTPESLEMDNDDLIDVFSEQDGGSMDH